MNCKTTYGAKPLDIVRKAEEGNKQRDIIIELLFLNGAYEEADSVNEGW